MSLVTRRSVAGLLVTGDEEVGRWWRERLSLVTRRWRLAKLCSKVRISAASTFKSCFPLPPKSMLGSLFGAEKKSPKHPKFTVLYTSYPCFVWILEDKIVQSRAWSSEQNSAFWRKSTHCNTGVRTVSPLPPKSMLELTISAACLRRFGRFQH